MRKIALRANSEPIKIGGCVRIGTGMNGVPTSCFWKFWNEGPELYAVSRSGGSLTKISVHKSGQIHMHQAVRNKTLLAPLMSIGDSWLHAIELRFLVGVGAFVPPPHLVRLKKKKDEALLAHVESNEILILNLLVGEVGRELPGPFRNSCQVWRTSLGNGRNALLIGRVLPIDEPNSKHLIYLRAEVNPRANFEGKPGNKTPYIECIHANWGPGGNIVFVVPLGDEGISYDNEEILPPGLHPMTFRVANPNSTAPITAPGGEVIGSLSIVGVTSEFNLVKNRGQTEDLANVTLSVDFRKLRTGESFVRPTFGIDCRPSVNGVEFKSWSYPVDVRFDGQRLHCGFGSISVALRNSNLPRPIVGLKDNEELLVSAPANSVSFSADRNMTVVSMPITCRFRIREILKSSFIPCISTR
jgi:hypothetical protein